MKERQASAAQPHVVVETSEKHEGWDDPVHGRVKWQTLFSSEVTPTESLYAGIAEIEPGDEFKLHYHPQVEMYYVLEGRGILSIDEEDYSLTAGTAIFIPGNALHHTRNTGNTTLRFLYTFPASSIHDVEYHFKSGY